VQPTATWTPTRTPMPTPTGIVCGQVVWATSCTGPYLYPILIICDSNHPVLWQPPSFTPEAFYRIYNPELASADLCTIEYGNITKQIASWSGYEEIASCDECGTFFLLPISYPGRTKGTSEGFHATFNSKVTAAFDHTLPGQGQNGQHRPFTGKTYTAADCPTGKLGIMCYDGHNGTDFDDRPGDQRAFAVAAGTVTYVGDNYDGYGKRVEITHGSTGYTTIYCHLAGWSVSVGQQVDHTTQVGIIGDTGWGCPEGATHLHLTVKYQGTVVDPTGWWHRTETDPWEVQSGVTSRYLWAYPINVSESINPAVGGAFHFWGRSWDNSENT
jgi:murein DD-endopeptidase MepM/ murein hydrolase activator NlpD